MFGNALGNSIVDSMGPQSTPGLLAQSGAVDELQEVQITPRYVGPGMEAANARLDNNPINVVRSSSDGTQSSSAVLTTEPSAQEELVVTAQRLSEPQKDSTIISYRLGLV